MNVEIKLEPTPRGFARADFTDYNGQACSLQESSLADTDAIWLGCNSGEHHHVTGACLARMHLTREQVAALIPLLQRFVDTGYLTECNKPPL